MTLHPKRFTEGGKEYVRIPAKEFDNIMEALEEADDALKARAILTKIHTNVEETMPATFVRNLITATAGEKIALWRKHRGIGRDSLAKMIGVTGASITMIETGKRTGSIDTFRKIADALECDLDDIA